uniref:Uncharacterized protein n=1 Tax=Oryza brachyantha TaxID=4533 RepID=J3MHX3_ORYBR
MLRSARMSPMTERTWRTASTTLPVPASPLVRIMAAPSRMRRRASPRSRQPQTKGTRKLCLADGFQDLGLDEVADAGLGHDGDGDGALDVADEARVGHAGDAALARMSAGTRSRAMTAQAPASSAMRAWSGVTTSMMTPPRSIWARPTLTEKVADLWLEGSRRAAPLVPEP